MSDVQCYDCEGDEWCHTCNGGGCVSVEQLAAYRAREAAFIDVVFDGPPSHEPGRFVEVENEAGASVKAGEWIDRGDGYWALRIRLRPM